MMLTQKILKSWLDYLGVGPGAAIQLDLLKDPIKKSGNYSFVQGWGSPDLPILLANSTDQHVRIPGNLKGHGVVVHPLPTLAVAAGWKSPSASTLKIEGAVTHAHPECGNGVAWSVELRRGPTRQRLAAGVAQGGKPVKFGPISPIAVHPGDLISLIIGPRDGNHSCDLTDLEFILAELKTTVACGTSPATSRPTSSPAIRTPTTTRMPTSGTFIENPCKPARDRSSPPGPCSRAGAKPPTRT